MAALIEKLVKNHYKDFVRNPSEEFDNALSESDNNS